MLKLIHLLREMTNNIISPNINDGAAPGSMKGRAPMVLNHLRTGEDKTLHSGTKSKACSLRHRACLYGSSTLTTALRAPRFPGTKVTVVEVEGFMIIGTITAQNSIALYTEGAYHLVISLLHAGSHPFQASNIACDRATCRSTT